MQVYRQINPALFEASAPLDHITVSAGTMVEAQEALAATLSVRRFATTRLRKLRRATHIAFDPQVRAYVADCAPGGIAARGMTRQDAWDNLLKALRLADMARAAEEIDLREPAGDNPDESMEETNVQS